MITCQQKKKVLRNELKQVRNSITLSDRTLFSNQIAEILVTNTLYQNANFLMLYLSMQGEPDTTAILGQAWQDGKQVCVPFMHKNPGLMDAALIADEQELVCGKYGIRTPKPEKVQLVDPTRIDCILVPGLAFDRHGKRLGMGAGYYDRFLPRTKKAVTIGLAFSCMLLSEIPTDHYDVSVNYVLTEKGIIDCSRE